MLPPSHAAHFLDSELAIDPSMRYDSMMTRLDGVRGSLMDGLQLHWGKKQEGKQQGS